MKPNPARLLFDAALLLLLLTIVVAVWAGSQPQPDPAWNRVQAAGVLRIGTDPTYPPFESLQDGEFVGYDVDLGRALAKRLHVRAEFVSLSLDGQYDALFAGKVDILISALPFIYERQKEVRYSQPYYQGGPLLVVRAAAGPIAAPADLAGRRLGVELGSDADMAGRRLQKTEVPSLILVPDYHTTPDALSDLVQGRIDAAVSDPLALAAFPERGRLRALDPPLADEPYVVALKRDSPRLASSVDATISDLRASGSLARIMGTP
ncbi:MAG: ABC transporter substrate-binding protein [Chloroflexia bacterium]